MRRQDLVTALVGELQNITVENGFSTDAGANVSEWRTTSLESGELPAIIVRDVADEAADDQQTIKHLLKFEIEVYVGGSNVAENMRIVSSDVLTAFGLFEAAVSQPCRYLGSESMIEAKETTSGGVRLEFEVAYQSQRWEQ